jgi:hypothetical protein
LMGCTPPHFGTNSEIHRESHSSHLSSNIPIGLAQWWNVNQKRQWGLRRDIEWDDSQFWKANRRDTGTKARPNGSRIKRFNSRIDSWTTDTLSNGVPEIMSYWAHGVL